MGRGGVGVVDERGGREFEEGGYEGSWDVVGDEGGGDDDEG